ncbi:hypothetical protein LY90DRAFT_502115 [Neocallimastix californiae]|uniref:Uncharacterized protein n=1 Tax=Neocallimastix californiae TaxID=1754190 RepID=A0A1Y2EVH6_9FUNG|nr:hypothetical protein LY90DRAFT_502115 [Neocallimastix californiae]|eukprot:ORY75569.1 hypothetical protein LY90DRAFT_502115 [Neocallimastix californiae]
MNLKLWYITFTLLINISVSINIIQCHDNEKNCGNIYCIPQNYVCCTDINNSPFYCNKDQKCDLDGICTNKAKMDDNNMIHNIIFNNNNIRNVYRYNNTLITTDYDKENDDKTFVTSSYFNVIIVFMIASVLLMVLIVWFYGCGLRDRNLVKGRSRKEFIYPSYQSRSNRNSYDKIKKRLSKNKVKIIRIIIIVF